MEIHPGTGFAGCRLLRPSEQQVNRATFTNSDETPLVSEAGCVFSSDVRCCSDQVSTRGRRPSDFAARPSHGFLWRTSPDGQAYGVNHDSSVRLRRQDRPPEWLETGAFYVFRTAGFREANHRFFGRVELVEVGAEDSLEIDDHADLRLAQSLARFRPSAP